MNRDFKGVWIPKEIWENENLNLTEKVLQNGRVINGKS